MTKQDFNQYFQDVYEYHGNTAIEFIRKQSGVTIMRDWILFDSVEEAQEYFNDNCGEYRRYYVH